MDLLAKHRAQLKPTSFDLDNPAMKIEDWLSIGEFLGVFTDSTRWWIGDWLSFGEALYGETHAQGLNITGLAEHTVANYRWVAKHVPKDVRREALSFSHHEAVARMTPTDQEIWLEVAEKENLNRKEFRDRIKTGTPERPRPEQPQWSKPDQEVLDPPGSTVPVEDVRDAMSDAMEILQTPLEDMTPAMIEETRDKMEEVLGRVEQARAIYIGNAPILIDDPIIVPLKEVATCAQEVVRSSGKNGLSALRAALAHAGYDPDDDTTGPGPRGEIEAADAVGVPG